MTATHMPEGRRRWARGIGAGLAAILVATGITGMVTGAASADPTLPPMSASELLNRVATADVDGMSATFSQRSDLGLPTLPSDLGEDGEDLQTVLTLLTGDHTFRVWQAGATRSRVSLVDGDAESSLIRNQNTVWTWSSASQRAGHATLDTDAPPSRPASMPSTPAEAVDRLLTALEPNTEVTTSGTGYVAGRGVYQLILTPRDSASLVREVRVSVDAVEFVPLGLRVVDSSGADAITLAATSVDFAVPDSGVFEFTPPPGATVTEMDADHTGRPSATPSPTPGGLTTYGTGWTTVAVKQVDTSQIQPEMRTALESLPAVSGTWGTGRLLSTSLVNAILTDDGRLAIGSVNQDRLYAALAK